MKKTIRIGVISLCTASLLFLMASCGTTGSTQGSLPQNEVDIALGEMPADDIPENYVLRLGAGTLTGTYYQYAIGSLDLVSKYAVGWQASPTVTSGSGETFALLEAGEVDTCTASAISYACAVEGIYAFDHPLKGGELYLWSQVAPEYLHICTRADSPYTSLTDMKGARLSVGLPGSGTYATGFKVLADLGIDDPENYFEIFYLANSDAISALQDGSIDAILTLSGLGGTPGQLAESASGLKLIGLSEEEMERAIGNNPYYFKNEIPAGYYTGNDKPIPTLSDMQLTLSYADVPEDVVYQYVKLLNTYYEDLVAVNPSFETATAEQTVALWEGKIAFHPGAERYYREIGLID